LAVDVFEAKRLKNSGNGERRAHALLADAMLDNAAMTDLCKKW
jgi:hypothetical protein